MGINGRTVRKEPSLTKFTLFSSNLGWDLRVATLKQDTPKPRFRGVMSPPPPENAIPAQDMLLKVPLVLFPQLDHYPSVSYHLPSSSDTLFNAPKALFLGKVIGKSSGQVAGGLRSAAARSPGRPVGAGGWGVRAKDGGVGSSAVIPCVGRAATQGEASVCSWLLRVELARWFLKKLCLLNT